MNLIFHIALPICAFIAGVAAGIIVYRGRLRDAISQLTLTNAYLEAEKELKEEAVKAAETEESLRMDELAEKQRVFECLVDAVSKMPVPFNMRQRDQFGRFMKVDPIMIAYQLARLKNKGQSHSKEIQRLCDEIRDNAITEEWTNVCDLVATDSALEMGRTLNIKSNAVTDVTPNSSRT